MASITIFTKTVRVLRLPPLGLFDSEAKSLAILILGGGVPKNYSLQPEPTLSQIFFLKNIRGYDYDAQIVSSPVTDGSFPRARRPKLCPGAR